MTFSIKEITALAIAVIGSGQVRPDDPEHVRRIVAGLMEAIGSLAVSEDSKAPFAGRSGESTTITITANNFVVSGGNNTYVWPQVVALAKFLYDHAGRTFSTQEIINGVLSGEQGPYAVYTLVGDLRRAIGARGSEVIKSGRGRNAGYTWNPEFSLVLESGTAVDQ